MYQNLFLTVLIIIPSILNSQSFQTDERVWDMSSQRAFSDLGRMKTSKSNLSNIEGSKYFDLNFKEGTVENYNKDIFFETTMRYNAYDDEIEIIYIINGKNTVRGLLQDKKIIIKFDGNKYQYLSFKNSKDRTVNGYLIDLFKGSKIQLYQKKRKKFLKGKIAKNSLDISHSPKYVDDFELYISNDGSVPRYIKNSKKELINYFRKSEEIKKYIKSEKLKFDNFQSFVKVLDFHENNYKD